MTSSIPGILAQSMSINENDRFADHPDPTLVPFRNIPSQSPPLKLIKGGLSENVTCSRPEKIIGEIAIVPPKSSARALLKFAGTWVGNDLERCLEEMYSTRGEAEF
jgi:hypothetical protein